jgi:hypothetical protein
LISICFMYRHDVPVPFLITGDGVSFALDFPSSSSSSCALSSRCPCSYSVSGDGVSFVFWFSFFLFLCFIVM